MCGTGKSQISFAEVPLSRATEYAAEDAEVAWRLWTLLELRLPIEGGTRIYEMVDRPLVATVETMERAGIMVDRDYLARLSGEFANDMLRIEGEIHALAGRSEERRVGKGCVSPCRLRWVRYHLKKKQRKDRKANI